MQCPSLYACRILYVFSQYLSGLFIGFVTSYCLLCSVLVVLFGCLSKVWIMVLNTVSCDSSFINCSWQYYWWFLWELWHMVSKDTLLKVNFTFEKYNILSILSKSDKLFWMMPWTYWSSFHRKCSGRACRPCGWSSAFLTGSNKWTQCCQTCRQHIYSKSDCCCGSNYDWTYWSSFHR